MMKKRVVLAEYFTVEDRTLLFIVRNDFDKPHVVEIERRIDDIQQFVLKNFQAGTNASGEWKSTSDKVKALDEQKYQDFFNDFVAPLADLSPTGDLMTEEGDIIWFVPHNFLHYLPLHALKVEGRYLIERNPICYTPSASVMKYCHAKRKNKREKALVLGDSRSDLAHACEEASIVADLFDTTPYLQERATKSLIKQKLEQEGESLDILHFCCHGRFRQDDALKSCIVLAQEGEGDEEWNLTAEEILQLQMQAELVTLSACETGINENRPGDELIGLTRALIYAGTPSVIVSLWAVDDLSSGLLMEHFYQKFCQPIEENNQLITKAEALQAASLYIKNMKVQEVIDYYKFRLGRLDRVRDKKLGIKFQISLANMEIYAGNPQAAIEIYQSILDQLSEEVERASELAKQIKNKLPSLKLKARLLKQKENSTIDYAIQPFNRLFYWASFVLVGDWK
jgi:CHAT domain-containing protein